METWNIPLPPEGLHISTEKALLDVDVIHQFLSAESYWSAGIRRELVERAIESSLCFGAYIHEKQVGYARVITDYATFAYLCDVFVVRAARGQGIGKALMHSVVSHPSLTGLRRWLLATRDAHALYAGFGFTPLSHPDRLMERFDPDVFLRASGGPG